MNIDNLTQLRNVIDLLLERESRVNEAKPTRYWYPLSLATYGSDEIIEAVDSMCSFRTSMAEKTLKFERKFSSWQGSVDSVMVNSGSSADLLLCLLLTNPLAPLVEPGAEVIIPIVTWPTQIWSAMMAGLKVRFVDVDPETLNVDLDDLANSITPATRALFIVHLMGNPCDMDRVGLLANRYGLHILEDCCESMGATWGGKKVGNFGLGAAYSFFFSHHITCMEGGMVAAASLEIAEHLRVLRAHGWIRNIQSSRFDLAEYPEIDSRYAFVNWGLNVRPTEVQASFGLRQLEKIDAFGLRRDVLASRFNTFVATNTAWLKTPAVAPRAAPSWLALPIMVAKDAPFSRGDLVTHLEKSGIETRPIVTGNVAKHPVAKLFPEFLLRKFPGADQIHSRGFYIGLSPLQTDTNVDRMLEAFDQFLRRY
jgi:CDP-6-deoxy-D-xylo-4-hexulose-3-dehydrase